MKKKLVKVTIKDVAKHAGVSTTTISRFLNGRYEAMGQETKEKIQKSIEMLDFKPNQLARGLRNDRSNTIGFVVADIGNPYSVSVIQGMEEICSQLGYSIIICNANEDPEKERESLMMLESKHIDGLIINSSGKNNDLLMRIGAAIPVLLIDRKLPGMPFSTVTTDNTQGTLLAIEHLTARGCDRLHLFISDPDGISPRYERIYAFEQFAKNNNNVQTSLDIIEEYSQALVNEHVRKLVESKQPTEKIGLIAGNGKLSLMVLKAIHHLNYQVPEDLLLIGFDDPEWASIARPTLTVLSQPTYEIGRQAAEMIFAQIQKGQEAPPQTLELMMQLIQRESTEF
ncbi:LacI family DNA-binding transcriptional regulator [Brevibacillus reuszeri]|uniref:LacI family DNA-binding transcriptional regulator n=1 Tax=Brevibacillus reuszeri TaxID=54915 RepID=UPI002898731E|nr:LacI family DNA-binding transcriptional regulator [Brevibacillus reuszeri]